MRSCICHSNQTSPIEAQSGVKFILYWKTQTVYYAFLHILMQTHADCTVDHLFNFVNNTFFTKVKTNLERATVDGLPTRPGACRITSLNNEIWHHTMKDCAIIVTCKNRGKYLWQSIQVFNLKSWHHVQRFVLFVFDICVSSCMTPPTLHTELSEVSTCLGSFLRPELYINITCGGLQQDLWENMFVITQI